MMKFRDLRITVYSGGNHGFCGGVILDSEKGLYQKAVANFLPSRFNFDPDWGVVASLDVYGLDVLEGRVEELETLYQDTMKLIKEHYHLDRAFKKAEGLIP